MMYVNACPHGSDGGLCLSTKQQQLAEWKTTAEVREETSHRRYMQIKINFHLGSTSNFIGKCLASRCLQQI